MNGYLTEDGTYYEVDKGVGHHYKFLRESLPVNLSCYLFNLVIELASLLALTVLLR